MQAKDSQLSFVKKYSFSKPLISVIIPAYNEEGSIGFVLDSVYNILGKMPFAFEIVVVDDGSLDNTAKIASSYDVILLTNNANLGKGSALITGFNWARGELVITMDADGSHLAEDIPKLLYSLLKEDKDSVIGSRFDSEMGKESTNKLNYLGNRIIKAVFLFMTGKSVSDSQSGFRVFKRRTLKQLKIKSTGFDVESELTIKLLKKGFTIGEIPITCKKRRTGYSRIHPFKDGIKILMTIMRFFFMD